jgi:hypothetical protein
MENFPILSDYLEDKLKNRWELYKENIINSHPELSPIAAGCFAARILENEFDQEYSKVYNYYAKKGDSPEFLDFVDNCNYKMEDDNFKNNLVDWSSTRWAETDSEIKKYTNAAHGLEPNVIKEREEKRAEYERIAAEIEKSLKLEKEEKERKYQEYLVEQKRIETETKEKQETRLNFWKINHPSYVGRGFKIPFGVYQDLLREDMNKGIVIPEIVLQDYNLL